MPRGVITKKFSRQQIHKGGIKVRWSRLYITWKKLLPSEQKNSPIQGFHKIWWLNSENVNMQHSVRLIKMTKEYLYCLLKEMFDILERNYST
jgi:hypothetical protein